MNMYEKQVPTTTKKETKIPNHHPYIEKSVKDLALDVLK